MLKKPKRRSIESWGGQGMETMTGGLSPSLLVASGRRLSPGDRGWRIKQSHVQVYLIPRNIECPVDRGWRPLNGGERYVRVQEYRVPGEGDGDHCHITRSRRHNTRRSIQLPGETGDGDYFSVFM